MGQLLNFFGWFKKNKADQTDILYTQGVRFVGAKNKHLRLYFQSQFSPDLEEDDLTYLTHIFEQKTYLLFGSHYSIINLISTDGFLKETYEKLVDTNYRDLAQIKITNKFLDNPEMSVHIFNYKIITSLYNEYKICRVNYWAQKSPEISEDFNVSPKVIENIRTTNEIQFYNFLGDNTNLIYFVLKKIFEAYSKSVTKVKVYQIGMKTIDENIFTFIASYVRNNPKVDTVCIYGKSLTDFRHLKVLLDEQPDEKDEKLEGEIHNVQHIFNLYQVLAKRTNLVELSLILFLNNYNFAMLSMVIKNNLNLRVINIRNVLTRDMDAELDYAYKEFNEIPDTIKDEIFIFFNYLFNLEFLEELRLTHFSFMSDINFMAAQVAKTLKNIRIFDMDKNQALIVNDSVMTASYKFCDLGLEYLNMGYTYYHCIRNWDYLLPLKTLTYFNAGVVDYVSFAALMRFLEKTNLEKVIVKLNKPVLLESIPILFEQIGTHPMRAKNLKYFYVLNAFDFSVKSEDAYKNKAMPKLFNVLRMNNTIRRLGFNKPGKYYYEIKDDPPFKTFKYIRVRDYDSCIYLIKSLQRLFKNFKPEIVNELTKNILIYRFATYRKFITG